MESLRRWQSEIPAAHEPIIAADARLSRTNYADDQSWLLDVGEGTRSALALKSAYGGRAGRSSLVPMWFHDGHAIYQAQTYYEPPRVVQFAPNLLIAEAQIREGLHLQATFWAMESHAVGCRYRLDNQSGRAFDLRLDLVAQVVVREREQKLGIITLPGEAGHAISLGWLSDFWPVVMMEAAQAQLGSGRIAPKIGLDLHLEPGAQRDVRWVHAGLEEMHSSLELAHGWLQRDWDKQFERIDVAAEALPIIETGDAERDFTLALSVNRVAQSLLKSTGSLPKGTFVAERLPSRGWSPKGDGSDHIRSWAGQDPFLALMVTPVMATLDPLFAQGIVQNYLAVQADDGSIDMKPGPGDQTLGVLCPPVLARLTHEVARITDDESFVQAAFPRLMRFFAHWLQQDADGDGFPEWQDERQTGLIALPTFATGREWGQGADIRTVETPDMLAYLISEARALRAMADQLGETDALGELDAHLKRLREHLAAVWDDDEGRYVYRDRDAHTSERAEAVLSRGRGDEEHFPAQTLQTPSRLIVQIVGGVSHIPALKVMLEGVDYRGKKITETLDEDAFLWQRRNGLCTTQTVFAQIDRIWATNLSRVYTIDVRSIDLRKMDINGLLPLWGDDALPDETRENLATAATVACRVPNGVTIVAPDDVNYDPSSAKGGGGVWPTWLTLVCEGLIRADRALEAGDILRALLATQTQVLKQTGAFGQFYHSEEPKGLGITDHLEGIAPLWAFMQAVGVMIASDHVVWTGGPFAWGQTVTLKQHGVTVQRDPQEIVITFPGGHEVKLKGDAPWQRVEAPSPAMRQAALPADEPEMPTTPPMPPSDTSVVIEVEQEDDDEEKEDDEL